MRNRRDRIRKSGLVILVKFVFTFGFMCYEINEHLSHKHTTNSKDSNNSNSSNTFNFDKNTKVYIAQTVFLQLHLACMPSVIYQYIAVYAVTTLVEIMMIIKVLIAIDKCNVPIRTPLGIRDEINQFVEFI